LKQLFEVLIVFQTKTWRVKVVTYYNTLAVI
jgi:hypothetical protein